MDLTTAKALRKGKYLLEQQLGNGIFNFTYRATDTESGQAVVIKTLAENLCQHADFKQFKHKFLELAQAFRQCQHPHLVKILDCFEERGRPYIVMEYIAGKTLAELMKASPLLEAKAFAYIHQIGNAVSVIHKSGLLHRDIRPENIIWCQARDCVILCEFGITCELTPGVMQTQANLLGAGYAPLEQYTPKRQRTQATDIYALAATLYFMLTGEPPLPAPVRRALHDHRGTSLFCQDSEQDTHKHGWAIQEATRYGLEIATHRRPQTVETWLSLLPGYQKILKPKVAVVETIPILERNRDSPFITLNNQKSTKKNRPLNLKTAHPAHPLPKMNESAAVEESLKQKNYHQTAINSVTLPKITKIPTTPTLESVSETSQQLSEPFTQKYADTTVKGQSQLPWQALLMTSAIAASAGMGFGFALRFHSPNRPGATLLHTEQSFPPRSDWSLSEPEL
ncbi:MAG: serine/threonine protein kinase [Symploca sp. SIO2B6]|nr:serine/threonine protein kinase [Symploca sp. SIO2B6]